MVHLRARRIARIARIAQIRLAAEAPHQVEIQPARLLWNGRDIQSFEDGKRMEKESIEWDLFGIDWQFIGNLTGIYRNGSWLDFPSEINHGKLENPGTE